MTGDLSAFECVVLRNWHLVKKRRLGETVQDSNVQNQGQDQGKSQGQARMEKGFNSDVIFRGLQFHVQTEDWGRENPFLVSRVYQNGAVVKSMKTPYSDVLARSHFRDPNLFKSAISSAMRDQHQRIMDALVSGDLI